MKRYTQVQDTQMLTGGLEHFTVTGEIGRAHV